MNEHVGSGRRVFRRCGVPKTRHDAAQVQLQPLMFWTWWTANVLLRYPVVARSANRLELEYPRIVLIVQVLVRDQFDVATGLRADQGRPWLLPDKCPILRVADPEGLRSWPMPKPGMVFPLRMSTCLHPIIIPT